jgi:hypothetical protein
VEVYRHGVEVYGHEVEVYGHGWETANVAVQDPS